MISGDKSAVVVLEKQKEELSPRVLELRKKIQDKSYMDTAIQRIAQVISRKLVENPDDSIFGD